MPLQLTKSLNDLMTVALNRIQMMKLSDGRSLTANPGGVTRLLLAVINNSIEDFYTTLQESHLMSFLSTATEEGLDLVGAIVNCKRNNGEGDNEFKTRISQQATALEAANELAIRLAALSVTGVQDVRSTPFSHGTGSFSLFIITNQGTVTNELVEKVKENVDKVVAYGTKFNVSGPDLIGVELGVKLIFLSNATNTEDTILKVKENLRQYINSKTLQESLIMNEIIETVMATSDDIYDMNIYHYSIDDVPVLTVNQDCRWNERFIESTKPDSITVV